MTGYDSWEFWYGTDPDDPEFGLLSVIVWTPIK